DRRHRAGRGQGLETQLRAAAESWAQGVWIGTPERAHRACHRRHDRAMPAPDHYRGTGAGDDRAAQEDAGRHGRCARGRWSVAEEVRVMHTELLIGNRLEAGQGPANSVVNPRTGQTLINLADATVGQVDAAVNAAAKAFEKWSLTTPVERCTYLLKIADMIEREADAFAELEALNCGKPKHLMLRDEIPAIADCFRFFAGAVRCMHGPLAGEYLAGHTSMIRRDPLGVIASIAPWNYPLMMGAWKLAPALAAGNTVVLKPSELTPLTTLLLAKLLSAILPEGVVNVVAGRGSTVGDALIRHPKVAMVSLTGSIATGEKVVAAAAKPIKRTHRELGGKAPVVVFDDADLSAVVEGIRTFAFYNAGQDCTAACRIYAGSKIYDRLVADLASAAQPGCGLRRSSPGATAYQRRHGQGAAGLWARVFFSAHGFGGRAAE